ncbi:hypothetical protein BU17DRAFT_60050 [Hysterangium stoloniferum]|nr:hypothetical protein BU17DRAFT_60050 [Hysterangium stoloniferum]
MEREVVVADDERVSMARDDGLVMWPGSDPRPRDWSRILVKKLAVEEASLHTASSHSAMSSQFLSRIKDQCHLFVTVYAAYSTSNGINTSGTCKFARDGPSYAIRIPEMDMGLYFYEEWQMTGSCDLTLYCPPGACSS